MKSLFKIFILFLILTSIFAQETIESLKNRIEKLQSYNESLTHRLDVLQKNIDDVLWYERLKDVAFVDKVFITGPPYHVVKNPTEMGVNNPLKFWSYIYIPIDIDFNKKYPLVILPHGGVHGDFNTYYTHIIKELMYQQYIVIAPEYRGSTGYGEKFYKSIDYGGLEIDDTYASKKYMLENYDFVDKNRVGIIGWSHGGLITLMNIFNYPDDYQVAFAGVPVSDLIARMGYYDDNYRKLFSAPYHIGKTVQENVEEYKRRSPAWNTNKFKNTPLLIHTNTNDDDVNVLEVEHLIKSLKAENKKFEYEIYKDIEGGHSFDRIDTKIGKEIRIKIWKYLAKYLKPNRTINNLSDILKAGYLK